MPTVVVNRSSTITGKDETREVKVDRVTVASYAEAKRARVIFAEHDHGDFIRVVTVDGKKVDFPKEKSQTPPPPPPPPAN